MKPDCKWKKKKYFNVYTLIQFPNIQCFIVHYIIYHDINNSQINESKYKINWALSLGSLLAHIKGSEFGSFNLNEH